VAGRQPAERKCLGASAWAVCETGRHPIRGRREIFGRRGRVLLPPFWPGKRLFRAPRARAAAAPRVPLSWRLGKKDLGRGGARGTGWAADGEKSHQLLRASWAGGLLKLQTPGSTCSCLVRRCSGGFHSPPRATAPGSGIRTSGNLTALLKRKKN
jgi:hypothetical protein